MKASSRLQPVLEWSSNLTSKTGPRTARNIWISLMGLQNKAPILPSVFSAKECKMKMILPRPYSKNRLKERMNAVDWEPSLDWEWHMPGHKETTY